MKARSTTEARYMTFTDAWKKEIWLKGLLTESRYELRLVAGIATGCLDEGGTWTQVTTLLGVAECCYRVLIGNYYLPLISIKGVACEVISKWKAGLKDGMDARSDVYVLCNGCRNTLTTTMSITEIIHQATKGLLDKAKGNVLGMEIIRDQSGNTLRVSQSRFYNEKMECQVACTRPDIASADVGMLDGFDRELQTYVQVFVDFDYAMGRSITVMGIEESTFFPPLLQQVTTPIRVGFFLPHLYNKESFGVPLSLIGRMSPSTCTSMYLQF
nr:hypothetical protein [Tanacetum cinerariifolium]